MSGMERDLTAMHETVNSLNEKQKQLEAVLAALPAGEKYAGVKRDGEAAAGEAEGVGRGDGSAPVEGVRRRGELPEQKFTANYLFLINQTESDLPRVNQSSLDRLGTAGRASGPR